MKLSVKGYNLIKGFEGIKNKAYLDSKSIPTIGIGFIKINNVNVKLGDTMTDEQIELEFLKQIGSYEQAVNTMVTSTINQNQFDSLVSFAYNVGTNALKNSTLLKLINNNPTDPKITDAFKQWCKAGGITIKGLLNRRIAEGFNYFSA